MPSEPLSVISIHSEPTRRELDGRSREIAKDSAVVSLRVVNLIPIGPCGGTIFRVIRGASWFESPV
jgi:hypothetical protein